MRSLVKCAVCIFLFSMWVDASNEGKYIEGSEPDLTNSFQARATSKAARCEACLERCLEQKRPLEYCEMIRCPTECAKETEDATRQSRLCKKCLNRCARQGLGVKYCDEERCNVQCI